MRTAILLRWLWDCANEHVPLTVPPKQTIQIANEHTKYADLYGNRAAGHADRKPLIPHYSLRAVTRRRCKSERLHSEHAENAEYLVSIIKTAQNSAKACAKSLTRDCRLSWHRAPARCAIPNEERSAWARSRLCTLQSVVSTKRRCTESPASSYP
jgi:hypothetical protein